MKRPIKDNERPWEDEGYLEDLENYIDHLEAKLQLLDIPIVSNRFKVDIDKVIKTEPKMIKESGFNLFG